MEVSAKRVQNSAHNLTLADNYYKECISQAQVSKSRHYFARTALIGLIRVKHAQGGNAAISSLPAEVEQLAQQYEYNDHLASLRLTQGHIAWEGNAPAWENGFDAALRYYQHALIYALRYNRFLPDEVLSGRPRARRCVPSSPNACSAARKGGGCSSSCAIGGRRARTTSARRAPIRFHPSPKVSRCSKPNASPASASRETARCRRVWWSRLRQCCEDHRANLATTDKWRI